jgi:hypothetical protein
MLATLLLSAATAVPAAQPDAKKDPPARMELFSREDWYKGQKGEEQEFSGLLTKVDRAKDVVGFGRVNPYKLTMHFTETVQVKVLVDGKEKTEVRTVTKEVVREVYVGGKSDILDPYVGKRVKLTGKAVTMEVEGKVHNEIWPARLEVLPKPAKLPAAGGNDRAVQQDPASAVDVFAKDDFYKKQEGKEQDFTGTLQRVDNKGKVGFGRNNPYRLISITYQEVTVERVVNGQVVKMQEKVPVQATKEIFVADKGVLLEPFVGKQIKITGKAVTLNLEGRTHNEIWPARVEVVQPLKLPVAGQDEGCCEADDPKELKIIAKGHWQYVSASPDGDKKGKQHVFRSAAELVAATPFKKLDAPQQVVEKKATEELAKALKVDTIDWAKQMVVVTTAGVKPTGGWKIDIVKATVEGKTCTVTWSLQAPDGIATQAFTHPAVAALVERCDGEVKFVMAANPKKLGPPQKVDRAQSPAQPAPGTNQAAVGEDYKIQARSPMRVGGVPNGGQLLIRNGKELLTALADAKNDEKTATENLAKALKVDGVDWTKQMVVVVSGGTRPTGGYSVEVLGAAVKDNKLIITWKLNAPKPGAIVTQALTHPVQTVLLPQFDGAVEFDPPMATGQLKKGLQ